LCASADTAVITSLSTRLGPGGGGTCPQPGESFNSAGPGHVARSGFRSLWTCVRFPDFRPNHCYELAFKTDSSRSSRLRRAHVNPSRSPRASHRCRIVGTRLQARISVGESAGSSSEHPALAEGECTRPHMRRSSCSRPRRSSARPGRRHRRCRSHAEERIAPHAEDSDGVCVPGVRRRLVTLRSGEAIDALIGAVVPVVAVPVLVQRFATQRSAVRSGCICACGLVSRSFGVTTILIFDSASPDRIQRSCRS